MMRAMLNTMLDDARTRLVMAGMVFTSMRSAITCMPGALSQSVAHMSAMNLG
jgi:hypothetical protein